MDSRKWLLSKLMPSRFGEKITQEISGPDGGSLATKSTDLSPEEQAKLTRGLDTCSSLASRSRHWIRAPFNSLMQDRAIGTVMETRRSVICAALRRRTISS